MKTTINVTFRIDKTDEGFQVETIYKGDTGTDMEMLEAAAASLVVMGHKSAHRQLAERVDPAVAAEVHSDRLYEFYKNTAQNLSEELDGLGIRVMGEQPEEFCGGSPEFGDLPKALSVIGVVGEIAGLAGDCDADLDPKLSTELTAEMHCLIDRIDDNPNNVSLEECNRVLDKVKSALSEAKNQQLN